MSVMEYYTGDKGFGEIQILDEDGKIYFRAKDVAIGLGYKDHI